MDRTEVLERMRPAINNNIRNIEHRPQTRVIVEPEGATLRPGGGQHRIEFSPEGTKSLSGFVGLPWNIASKLRPETFGSATTELLAKHERYSLVLRDNRIEGVRKVEDFHQVNPERVLRIAEEVVKGIEFHRVLILENFAVSLEVIGERRQPVNRGDLIQAGAQIIFSPSGTVNPQVRSYVLRLICTNGQTSNIILREFNFGRGGGGGEGDDIWQWFRQSIRDSYNALDQIVERYRNMVRERIKPEDRAMMLEAMLREAKITGKDANAIRAMAIDNPPQTSYDMMNLLTNATSHLLEDPRRIARAQEAVASYASVDEHARICPVCNSRRN